MSITCRNVSKSYATGTDSSGSGRVSVLRALDIDLEPSLFHAIMGASGSGKSTLLHLIAALDKPDEGEIVVDGVQVHSLSERDATEFRRTRVGIVFQQFNLIPTLTARENVELPGTLGGASGTRARAESLMHRLGIAHRAGHRPDALSGGEQQRVAIARALFYQPAVLLADEPTGSLDSVSSAALWSLLAELSGSERMTIVMVTHESTAAAHCDKVHVMVDGRIKGRIDTNAHEPGHGTSNGRLDAAGVAARYQELVR